MTDRFRAMGCEVCVEGAAAPVASGIRSLFEDWEQTFSRFRADSELTAVNSRAGRPTVVSSRFATAVRAAIRMAAATGGLVVPTLAEALDAAGYDRDLDELGDDPEPPRQPRPPADWRSVRLTGRVLLAPANCRLDLNGVVKAMAVDTAAGLLGGAGWVSAGGDLAARGGVDVSLPVGGSVRLISGGIATSGKTRRRWRRGGAWQHHLIDPTTSLPATTRWEQVTAVGATCLEADAAAKAAFLADDGGPHWLDRRGIPGRFVDADGTIVENESWIGQLRDAACT